MHPIHGAEVMLREPGSELTGAEMLAAGKQAELLGCYATMEDALDGARHLDHA